MADQGDIAAEVVFLPPEHGGWRERPPSGLRRQFYYLSDDWDAEFRFPNDAAAAHGTPVRAAITFTMPHEHENRLRPGLPFLIREGQRVLGYGVVLELAGLQDSARRMREYLHLEAAS